MRKPVGIVETDKGWTLVACDDGTVWGFMPELDGGDKAGWFEIGPPIPGSPEAMARPLTGKAAPTMVQYLADRDDGATVQEMAVAMEISEDQVRDRIGDARRLKYNIQNVACNTFALVAGPYVPSARQ